MPGKDAINSDPLIGAHFQFDVGNHVTGYFTEVGGLSSETEVVEHKVMSTGAKESVVRKIPGRLKWGDITLKRGITKNTEIWDWRKMVEEGKVDQARANCTITMFDQAHSPVAEWTIEKAWPSKVSGPQMSSDGNSVVLEELTIVCESFKRTL
jgi:phage tail-like protein